MAAKAYCHLESWQKDSCHILVAGDCLVSGTIIIGCLSQLTRISPSCLHSFGTIQSQVGSTKKKSALLPFVHEQVLWNKFVTYESETLFTAKDLTANIVNSGSPTHMI